jgi:hypothetical protein
MSGNTALARLFKDTLKKWDTITDITLDSKEFMEAKANVASDPTNNQYSYDLIKAANDIYKTYLSKCSSYYKKMMEFKKEFDKAYRANKTSAKLQEGLENYNFKNQIEDMEKLNAIIRSNNELIDLLQAEIIHNGMHTHGEHKSNEHKSNEHKSNEHSKKMSDIFEKANAKSYKELCEMLQAESSENKHNSNSNSNRNVEYEYITKLTGICALDEQTTNLNDLIPDNVNAFGNGNVQNKRVNQMTTIQKEALNIFTKKNHDYGDSFATYGPTGVIVRIGDKIQRLHSITRKGIAMVNDESIRDTLMDLHNYCAMAIMLMDEDKDKSSLLNTNVICEPGLGFYTVGDLQRHGQ